MSSSASTQLSRSDIPQRAINVVVAGPESGKSLTALVPFTVEIRSISEGSTPASYTFAASVSDNPIPAFTKQIELADPVATLSLALNSHLLSNGSTQITFSVADEANREVWRNIVPLQIANTGSLAETVRQSLRRSKTPLFVEFCDSSQYDYSDESLKPWFDRDDALQHIEQRLLKREISPREAFLLQDFVLDGYIVMEDMLDDSLLEQINREFDDAVAKKLEHREDGSSQGIHNLHALYPGVRQLWKHPRILRILSLIFEAHARPCQSLTYMFASQEDAHQDTVHLTAFPAGYMCGVWTALEDIQVNSGELELFKGTHRLPRVYMHDVRCSKVKSDSSEFRRKIVPVWRRMIQAGQFDKVVFRPKKGTVLIWHENLMYGTGIRIDTSVSRRSIMSHSFADGAIAYSDSSGNVEYMEPLENLRSSEHRNLRRFANSLAGRLPGFSPRVASMIT